MTTTYHSHHDRGRAKPHYCVILVSRTAYIRLPAWPKRLYLLLSRLLNVLSTVADGKCPEITKVRSCKSRFTLILSPTSRYVEQGCGHTVLNPKSCYPSASCIKAVHHHIRRPLFEAIGLEESDFQLEKGLGFVGLPV